MAAGDAKEGVVRKISLLQRAMFAALALIHFAANPAFAGDFRKLSGKEIKRLIAGKVVTDDVHYSDRFESGGGYEGVFMNKARHGRWRVDSDQLCITLETEPPKCTELWQSAKAPPRYQRRQTGLPSATDEVFIRAN